MDLANCAPFKSCSEPQNQQTTAHQKITKSRKTTDLGQKKGQIWNERVCGLRNLTCACLGLAHELSLPLFHHLAKIGSSARNTMNFGYFRERDEDDDGENVGYLYYSGGLLPKRRRLALHQKPRAKQGVKLRGGMCASYQSLVWMQSLSFMLHSGA
jgi:hypothetical protein